jgi:kynureninase
LLVSLGIVKFDKISLMLSSHEHARSLDHQDPLASFRDRFRIPQLHGKDAVYLCGNSLGLQPKTVAEAIQTELDDWAQLGVEGHVHAKNPWLS